MTRRATAAVVVVLCCGWIAATTEARQSVELATDGQTFELTGTESLLAAVCLSAGVVLLSGVLGVGGGRGAGGLVGAVFFAAAVSALLADGRLTHWDAMAAFLALAGVEVGLRRTEDGGRKAEDGRRGTEDGELRTEDGRRRAEETPALPTSDLQPSTFAQGALNATTRWGGLVLVGMACGCSPLCATGIVLFSLAGRRARDRILDAAAIAVLGVLSAMLIERVGGRGVAEAFTLNSDVARMGPHDAWRFVARWSDLLMPALVFALIAVSGWFFGGDADQKKWLLHGFEKGLAAWLVVNIVVGIIVPRIVVGHGLLLVLPAFLLVPAGWRMVRQLPFDRGQWTLSLFSGACHVLPFLLLWTPLRKAGEVVMVAMFPP